MAGGIGLSVLMLSVLAGWGCERFVGNAAVRRVGRPAAGGRRGPGSAADVAGCRRPVVARVGLDSALLSVPPLNAAVVVYRGERHHPASKDATSPSPYLATQDWPAGTWIEPSGFT